MANDDFTERDWPIYPLTNHTIKWKLIYKTRQTPSCHAAWERHGIEDLDWEPLFRLARKISNISKLQVFQFNLLHRNLPVNRSLTFKDIKTSPNCRLCGQEESIEHLLLECRFALPIWIWLHNRINTAFDERFLITTPSCLLGAVPTCELIKRYNWLALQLKYYLYLCQRSETWPSIQAFQSVLSSTFRTLTSGLPTSKEW